MQKHQTWIEISENKYKSNILFLKKFLTAKTELKLVVKANAYSHDLATIVNLANKFGEYSFAVHSLSEALKVKQISAKNTTLIMGPVLKQNFLEIINNNFSLAVFQIDSLIELDKITRQKNLPVNIHLKVETGTNRLGIQEKDIEQFETILSKNPLVKLEGIYTHFANIEDTTDHTFALNQLDRFNKVCSYFSNKGFTNFKRHTACSAAILLFPQTHMNLVRLGISQYGFWSSKETFVSYKSAHKTNGYQSLQQILTWKTKIGQIKTVPANQFIGYGCTYKTSRESKIAVLPVGYSDGIDRKLSNKGYFLVNGCRTPIRGRVCMNLTMIDVSDIPDINLEDEVVLIGESGDESISVEDWAGWIGTINYEMLIKINPNIPRIVV